MEEVLIDTFLCLCMIIPVTLLITVATGILRSLYTRFTKTKDTAGSRTPLTGSILAFLFREGRLFFASCMVAACLLYSAIFAWSIRTRGDLPPKAEYLTEVSSRSVYEGRPISRPANLIGAAKREIGNAFGSADKKQWISEQYEGVSSGRHYRIKILYIPVLERVFWYESELEVG